MLLKNQNYVMHLLRLALCPAHVRSLLYFLLVCGILSPAGTVLAAVQEYYDFPPTSAARRGGQCPTYHLRSTCTSRDFYSAITGG